MDLQSLFSKGKFSELLDLGKSVRDLTGRYWEIQALLYSGAVERAGELIREVEGDLLESDLRGKFLCAKGKYLLSTGKYDCALESLRSAIKLNEELGDTCSLGLSYLNLSLTLWKKGEVNEGIVFANKALEIFSKTEEVFGLSEAHNILGILMHFKGDVKGAMDQFEEGLRFRRKMGNDYLTSSVINNLGALNSFIGNLNRSLAFYQESLEIGRGMNNSYMVAMVLSNIGLVYWKRGELLKAREYLHQSLELREEMDNPYELSMSLNNLAIIYAELAEFEKSEEFFLRALGLLKEIGNTKQTSILLPYLINMYLMSGRRDKAAEYLNILHGIAQGEKNDPVTLYYKYAKGLFLKWGNRIKEKGQAQQLFEEIVEEDVVNIDITVKAARHLLELLILELKFYGEIEVLEEIISLINKIHHLAEKEHMFSVKVEMVVLRSKLALIQGKVEKAEKLLTEAGEIAEVYGLPRLRHQIDIEQKLLMLDRDEYLEFLDKKPSMGEKITHLKFIEYIWMNLGVKQEIPVLFMIINRSGFSIYSRRLSKMSDLSDTLISSMITAINSFAKEVFSVEGAFESIRNKDFTITFQEKSNYLFCYIYKGSSYYADKKVRSLVDEVGEVMPAEEWMVATPTRSYTNLLDRLMDKYFN